MNKKISKSTLTPTDLELVERMIYKNAEEIRDYVLSQTEPEAETKAKTKEVKCTCDCGNEHMTAKE